MERERKKGRRREKVVGHYTSFLTHTRREERRGGREGGRGSWKRLTKERWRDVMRIRE